MTSSTTPQPARPRRWSRSRIVLAVLLVGVLAAGAFGFWYAFLRPVPAAVSLSGATSAAASPSTSPSASPTATAAATTGTAATGAPVSSATTGSTGSTDAPAASGVEGTWTVDSSIGSFADFTNSFVGYRVQEVLAQIGSTTAVGRTPDVSGTLTVEGTTITAVEIEVDLTTLESDSDLRDGQLRRQGLETGQFPTGTFVLTDPIALDGIPADGETISVTGTGDLTLHGVTRSVAIPLQAQINNGVITVVGSLEIVFGDFGMTAPSAARVLEIDDHGVMEFQLHFTRA